MNNFAINRNRHEDFGKRLHNNNLFEAIRIHRTYVDQGRVNKCRPHVDNKNSKKGCLRRVLWWSALVMFQGKLTRIGMVWSVIGVALSTTTWTGRRSMPPTYDVAEASANKFLFHDVPSGTSTSAHRPSFPTSISCHCDGDGVL